MKRNRQAWIFVVELLLLLAWPITMAAQMVSPDTAASASGMNAQAIVTVSAAVVSLTQLFKWILSPPDKWGGAAVLAISASAVLFWGWSQGAITRANSWDYLAAWIAVSTSAAGVFGFTRAGRDVVASMKN